MIVIQVTIESDIEDEFVQEAIRQSMSHPIAERVQAFITNCIISTLTKLIPVQ